MTSVEMKTSTSPHSCSINLEEAVICDIPSHDEDYEDMPSDEELGQTAVLISEASLAEDAATAAERLQRAKAVSCFVLGSMVGALMQIYTWGATTQFNHHLKMGLPLFFLVAPLVMLPVIALLFFLRKLFWMVFCTNLPTESMNSLFVIEDHRRFVLGAIVGVCLSLTATDLVLGHKGNALIAVTVLVINLVLNRFGNLVFYRFGLCCAPGNNANKADATEFSDEDDLIVYPSGGYRNGIVI
jgi:hypothetical protein